MNRLNRIQRCFSTSLLSYAKVNCIRFRFTAMPPATDFEDSKSESYYQMRQATVKAIIDRSQEVDRNDKTNDVIYETEDNAVIQYLMENSGMYITLQEK